MGVPTNPASSGVFPQHFEAAPGQFEASGHDR